MGCFVRDIEIGGFPFAARTQAWFKRTGDIISGVLSKSWTFDRFQFPAGTWVRFYIGHRDGRVWDVTLGADQEVDGIPCKRGTAVLFKFYKRRPYIVACTLAIDHIVDGRPLSAGAWVELDRKGHLTNLRPPDWDNQRVN